MASDVPAPLPEEADIESIRVELSETGPPKWRRVFDKFAMAAIGSIPWVGGFIAAAASIKGDEQALRADNLQTQWLDEHQKRLDLLRETLDAISNRFEALGDTIEERVQSPEYLALVRQAFRAWDEAETEDKRRYIGNFIANAAGTRQTSDDVLRLFLTWLHQFHEAHFAVIREIYKNPGSTRFDIWSELYGELPREDSAEADLYKMLIRDLSTGSVIRQARDVNEAGQFLRRRPARKRAPVAKTMESAFEDTKQYLLTDLGKQFVHYTMNEVVGRLSSTNKSSDDGDSL